MVPMLGHDRSGFVLGKRLEALRGAARARWHDSVISIAASFLFHLVVLVALALWYFPVDRSAVVTVDATAGT
ncbi:MAG TPA: hypothetical protein ENJ16_04115, partial [Planctomycetaceae bacterium]|nr:hypothetical protein [Planctomycetaceae bacterium]